MLSKIEKVRLKKLIQIDFFYNNIFVLYAQS